VGTPVLKALFGGAFVCDADTGLDARLGIVSYDDMDEFDTEVDKGKNQLDPDAFAEIVVAIVVGTIGSLDVPSIIMVLGQTGKNRS
jgi:hypothetical protein